MEIGVEETEVDDVDLRTLGRGAVARSAVIAAIPLIFCIAMMLVGLIKGDTSYFVIGFGSAIPIVMIADQVRKGKMWALLLLNAALAVALILLLGNWMEVGNTTGRSMSPSDSKTLLFLGCCCLFMLAITVGGAIAAHTLAPLPIEPYLKAARGKWHQRLLPKTATVGFMALLFAMGLLLFVTPSIINALGKVHVPVQLMQILIAGPFFLVAGLMRQRWKRLWAASAAEARALDSRPPVLLLRSFGDDGLRVKRKTGWHKMLPFFGRHLTFEEVITSILWRMGPVITIGRPGEKLPEAGAAREYVSHENWQLRVSELLTQARLIVVIFGATPGLAWEYQQLFNNKVVNNTIFLMPPCDENSVRARWNAFRQVTGIHLSPEPGAKQIQELTVMKLEPLTDSVFKSRLVLSAVRYERSYEEALFSPLLMPASGGPNKTVA